MMKIIRKIGQFVQSLKIAQTIVRKLKWWTLIIVMIIHLGEHIQQTTKLCSLTPTEQVEYYSKALAAWREHEKDSKTDFGEIE